MFLARARLGFVTAIISFPEDGHLADRGRPLLTNMTDGRAALDTLPLTASTAGCAGTLAANRHWA